MPLSDADIAKIANAAADAAVEKALQKMYTEIGRGVLRKAAYVIGVGLVALAMWFTSGHGLK